jgi:hypothetical protein
MRVELPEALLRFGRPCASGPGREVVLLRLKADFDSGHSEYVGQADTADPASSSEATSTRRRMMGSSLFDHLVCTSDQRGKKLKA